MAYEDIQFTSVAQPQEQEFSPTQRNVVGDFGSKIYSSAIHGIGQAAKGIQQFTGTGQGLIDWSKKRAKDPFAREDVDAYLGRDGVVKKFGLDVAGTITESFVGTATGATLGGLASGGNALAAAAGGVAGLITQFGGGTYADLKEEGSRQGLVGEALHDFALKGALWEVIPELGDQAVTALSAGLLGPIIKGGKVGLKTALKSGKITPTDFMKGMVRAESELGATAIKLGGAAAMGGGSEVVTELGQEGNREDYGLTGERGNLGYLFLLGATASGGPASIGAAYSKATSKKRANDLAVRMNEGVNSEDVNTRLASSKQIYDDLLKYDPETAEEWRLTAEDSINSGTRLDLDNSFVEYYSKASDINMRKEWDLQTEASQADTVKKNTTPQILLNGRSTAQVLEKELKSAALGKIEANAKVSFDELLNSRTDVRIKKELSNVDRKVSLIPEAVETGLYAPETPVTEDVVEPTAKEKREAKADENMIRAFGPGSPLEVQTREDITEPRNIYEAMSARAAMTARDPKGMPGSGDIKAPEQFVPDTAHDRSMLYWLTPKEDRQGWDRLFGDSNFASPIEPVAGFSSAVEVANEVEKEVLVTSAAELAEKQEVLARTKDRVERSQARKDIASIKKDIEEETVALTPEVVEVEPEVKPEVVEEAVAAPVQAVEEEVMPVVEEEVIEAPVIAEKVGEYIDEKGDTYKVIDDMDGGTIEEHYKKGKDKPQAGKFITNIKGHDPVTYGSRKAAKAAIVAGKPIGKFAKTGQKGTLSKAKRAERVDKNLNDREKDIRDVLIGIHDLKTEDQLVALSNQILLNRGTEVSLQEYTLESILNDAGNIKRKRDTEASEIAQATQQGQAGSGINLSALEEEGGPAIDAKVDDFTEGMEGRERTAREGEGVSDVDAQRMEEGAESEEVDLGTAADTDTILTQYVKPTAIRFKAPAKKKAPSAKGNIYVSTGTKKGEELTIFREKEVTGTMEYDGVEVPVTREVYYTIDTEGNVTGKFGDPDEAAKYLGGTIGNRPTFPYEPDNMMEDESPTSQVRGAVEQIDGVQLLERAIADPNANDPIKALAKALLTNMASREKLRKRKVLVGESGRSYVVGGDMIHMANTSEGWANLHEAVHSITVQEMEANPKIKKDVVNLMKLARKEALAQEILTKIDMDEVSKDNKDYVNRDIYERDGYAHAIAYGLRNEREFLAQTFSSNQFRTFLEEIPLPKEQQTGTMKTLWDKFVSLIQNALGLSDKNYTALHKALALTMELSVAERYMESERNETTIEKKPRTGRRRVQGVDFAPVEKDETISDTIDRQLKQGVMERSEATLWGRAKKRVSDWSEKYLRSATDRLREISPKIERMLLDFEAMFNLKVNERLKSVEKYKQGMKEMKKVSPEDYERWRLARLNDNNKKELDVAEELERKYKVDSKGMYKVMDEVADEMIQYGLLDKKRQGYTPNRVKDYEGLMDHMRKDQPALLKQVKEILQAKGIKEPTDADVAKAYASTLLQGKYPALLTIPGSAKKKMIHKVDVPMSQFYEDPLDAMTKTIVENTDAIEQRRLVGKSSIPKWERKLAKATDPAEIELLQGQIENTEKETKNAINKWLTKEVMYNNLEPAKQQTVKEIFQARFNQKGVSKGFGMIKDIQLAVALGTPMSTITQLGDAPLVARQFGTENMMSAMSTILKKEGTVDREQFDFTHQMRDLEDYSTATSDYLGKVLTWTGFQATDTFFKNVGMEASLEKARKMSKDEFIAEYEMVYDGTGEAGRLYDDLASGKDTNAVKLFAFNQLSKIQPIATSRMPVGYMEGGNWRLAYALKSFGLTQMNNLVRDFREGADVREKMLAVSSGVAILTLAGAGTDCLKQVLRGEWCSFTEETVDNFLKLGFLSNYNLSKVPNEGVDNILKDWFMPPMDIISNPISDFFSLVDGEEGFNWETAKLFPVIGKLTWDLASEQSRDRVEKRMEEREE